MSRKLLMFGGLTVTSVATLTPGGIFLQKAIKTKQMKKERKEFVSKSEKQADELNVQFNEGRAENTWMTFLKDSTEDENKWKLIWIFDVWVYYGYHADYRSSLKYTKDEMNQAQQIYWDEQVSKQQGKWKDKATETRLQKANTKNQYWEKLKEMCQILISEGEINENHASFSVTPLWLCNFVNSSHGTYLEKYEKYRSENNPHLEIMEYIWTKEVKFLTTQKK